MTRYLYRVVDQDGNDVPHDDSDGPKVYRSMTVALNERDYWNHFQQDLAPFTVIRVSDPAWENA